jgi:hypothetical protein
MPLRHVAESSEAPELIYFKLYKSQVPVIEQALETAARMLGSDKSRGYCLELICADFQTGAYAEDESPRTFWHLFFGSYACCPRRSGRR